MKSCSATVQPRYRSFYEINTRAWLSNLTQQAGKPVTQADIDDSILDELTERGFDWIWLLSVWQTGKASRAVSLSIPARRVEFQAVLSDLVEEDICSRFDEAGQRARHGGTRLQRSGQMGTLAVEALGILAQAALVAEAYVYGHDGEVDARVERLAPYDRDLRFIASGLASADNEDGYRRRPARSGSLQTKVAIIGDYDVALTLSSAREWHLHRHTRRGCQSTLQ